MSEQPPEDAGVESAADFDEDLDADISADPAQDYDGAVDEALEDTADESFDEDPRGSSAAATGHPAVDEVLRSLDDLEGRPVDEHVAAFEEAHESLRRALSNAGDDTP